MIQQRLVRRGGGRSERFVRRPTRTALSLPVIFLLICAAAAPLAAQGTFSRVGNLTVGRNLADATLLKDGREWGTATRLKDGRVLVVGGTDTESDGSTFIFNDSEIFDPTTGTFTQGPSLADFRAYHSAVALPDGRVLVLGGSGVDTTTG